MNSSFYSDFLKFIETKYPNAFLAFGENKPYELLFSPTIVELSESQLIKIKRFISEVFKLSHQINYQENIKSALPDVGRFDPKNFSIFMSYDFHITKNGPKLIEINTNASLASFSALLCAYQSNRNGENLSAMVSEKTFFENCKQMILEEHRLSGHSTAPRIVITDDKPETQKAYSEFIFYRELFRSWGWFCEIEDTSDLKFDSSSKCLKGKFSDSYSFVYNRNTDFYFESPNSECLKRSYLDGVATISPNPREYALLADKERMLQLRDNDFLNKCGVNKDTVKLFEEIIPQTFLINKFSIDTPKKERENYFFKPRRSFGGKAVYNGKRISNKLYAELLTKDYLAQEIVEPPTVKYVVDSNEQDFKWDLRVYTYKDQPTHLIARLYQGQTTNTQTPGGGLAPIRIIK